MKLFKNIKFRLLAGLFIFLFIIFYGFGFFIIYTFKQHYNQSIESTLLPAVKDLKHEFHTYFEDAHIFEEIKYEFDIDLLYAQIILIENHKSTLLLKSNDLKEFSLSYNNIPIGNLSTTHIVFSTQMIPQLTPKKIKVATIILEQVGDKIVIMQCAIPFKEKIPFLENMKIFLWISLLVLLLIILVTVYYLLSKSLSQTKNVVNVVKNIKIDGEPHLIQPTNIAKEIDELIETFNTLINNLQISYKKVKDFGQNASHELKTPLTIIRGEIEVGLRKERSNEEYKTILKSIMQELIYLQEVIEKILFLSSNSNSDITKTFEEVYIDEIVIDTIEEKRAFAKMKHITLNLQNLEPTTKMGNLGLLKIVCHNLLDNAIKYSYENSHINISLQNDKLLIEDFGCGIPQNELSKIFDRFYRVDKVRNHKSGSGLGLSIVKNILELHDFPISIESIEEKHTKVTIFF
jgi:signal transduction histidine kinase